MNYPWHLRLAIEEAEYWRSPHVEAEAIPLLRETDPDSYTTITVCLPCANKTCAACYGEGCECACGGDRA